MTTQTINDIMHLLGSDDRESGFVEYMPPEAQTDLANAIRSHIEQQGQALDAAVEEGVGRLPIFLRIFAASMLK